MTLTTLGYGDIVPLTAKARSMAMMESITGVLYLAVLVSRLVAMYGSAESNRILSRANAREPWYNCFSLLKLRTRNDR